MEKIKYDDLIISNSIIMKVITVLNVKLGISKDILEDAYDNLNKDIFKTFDDTELYDEAMEKIIDYYPKRIPFFNCVYMALMENLGIRNIVSFDEHFDLNKNIKRIR
jgi:predicted nucleic acid-binding protein